LNRHPLHIKQSIQLPSVLTLILLLAMLQSPAQQHGKRHARHARHPALTDSVTTADEELQPMETPSLGSTDQRDRTDRATGRTGQADRAKSSSERTDGARDDAEQTDRGTGSGSAEQTDPTTAASPDSEEKEPPPVLRSVPDSVIDHRKKQREFAYANDPSWWKDPAEKRQNDPARSFYRLLDSKGFRYFIYIFLGAVLMYALYKIIAENNLRFFYRRPSRTESSPGEAALPEEDLDQLLKKALDAGAHRMAVRYLYLKTLRMLEARQLISWHIQTTDEEYARQLDRLPQGESFRWLMRAYERVWYGKFPVTDQQFARLLQYFQDFHTYLDTIRRA
jgi:hypothetical protein